MPDTGRAAAWQSALRDLIVKRDLMSSNISCADGSASGRRADGERLDGRGGAYIVAVEVCGRHSRLDGRGLCRRRSLHHRRPFSLSLRYLAAFLQAECLAADRADVARSKGNTKGGWMAEWGGGGRCGGGWGGGGGRSGGARSANGLWVSAITEPALVLFNNFPRFFQVFKFCRIPIPR